MKQTLASNYQALWSKHKNSHFQDLLDRGYAYHYDEDEQGSGILYVGINPSFSEGSKNESFVFDRNAPHSYFESFRSIKKELENEPYLLKDIKWTHLDVLVFRETNQKYIDTLLQTEIGIHFVYEQVMIARERIIHIQPKVIVVSNTKAKELMGKNRFKPENQDEEVGVWMDFQFKFDMEYGSHRITNVPELAHTRVFFIYVKRAKSFGLRFARTLGLADLERIENYTRKIIDKL